MSWIPAAKKIVTASTLSDIGLRAVLDLTDLTRNSSNFKTEMQKLTNVVEKVSNSITNAFEGASEKSSDRMATMAHRIQSIVGGIIVADVFRGTGRYIKEMTGQVAEAVDSFQRLEIQLETLVARDYAKAFGVSVKQAYDETSASVQELLGWISRVAVTTPFSAKDVGAVVAMGQAYGFTIEEAKRMTLTVGDFVASMGGGNEVLERIIYNLGQMAASGRPTGRELRDLANNFVPINTIADRFAEKMNKTRFEVLEMFRLGTISAREFTEEFLTMVEETVPGAMQRLARTFQTVRTNIEDFIQIMLGFRLLGPIANEVAQDLQNALENMLSDKNAERMTLIGDTLLFAYRKLAQEVKTSVVPAFKEMISSMGGALPTMDDIYVGILQVAAGLYVFGQNISQSAVNIGNSVEKILKYFNTSFEGLRAKMANWGKNAILAFAQGMASAISAVIQVLGFIGKAIAKLLKPGSPPLLLPELDVWGAEAMMAYMEGWKNADFSVFNEVGDILERAIMSWKNIIGEEVAIERILGSQQLLASIVEEYRTLGSISSDALSKLSNSIGIASEHIDLFILKSLKLSSAQALADAVDKMFDFTGLVPVNIFGQVVDSFQDLIDMADQFGDELRNSVIQYAEDSMRLVDVNQQIKAIQDQINTSTKEYDEILARLTARLNRVKDRQDDIGRLAEIDRTLQKVILTDRERERLELEKEQILLEREIRLVKEQRDEEKRSADDQLDGLKSEKDLLEERMRSEKNFIKEVSAANVNALKGELQALEDIINAQIRLNELLNQRNDLLRGKRSGSGSGDLEDLTGFSWNFALPEIPESIDISKELDDLWKTLVEQAQAYFDQLKEPFLPLAAQLDEALKAWRDVIEDPVFKESWNTFTSTLEQGFKVLTDFWHNDGKTILESIGTLLGTIFTHLFVTTDKTGESVIQLLANAFLSLTETISTHGTDISNFIDDVTKLINDKAFPKIKDILKELANTVIPKIGEFVVKSGPIVLTLLGFIVDNAEEIIGVISAFYAGKVGAGILFDLVTNLPKIISYVGLLGVALLFITNLKVLQWFKETFSEDSTAMQILRHFKDKVGDWFEETFGEGGTVQQKLKKFNEKNAEWWSYTFDPENSSGVAGRGMAIASIGLRDWAASLFGEEGPISTWMETAGINIDTWWMKTFGEGGTVPTWFESIRVSFDEWLNSIFGEEGSINTNHNDAKERISRWWTNVFGKGGTVPTWFENSRISFDEWLTSIFGEEGSMATFWNNAKERISKWWMDVFGEGGIVPTWFSNIFTSFDEWLDSIFGEGGLIDTWIRNIFSGSLLGGWITEFRNAGKSMLQGLYDGLSDSVKRNSILNDIAAFARRLIQRMRDEFGAHSPSTEGIAVGESIIEGLGKGIKQRTSDLREMMSMASPSKITEQIGSDFMKGFNIGLVDEMRQTVSLLQKVSSELLITFGTSMLKFNQLSASIGSMQNFGFAGGGTSVTNNKNIQLTINPTYEQYASPSSIYYDASAALSTVVM